MDTSLKQLMAEALRLTRAGDLRGATATIQAALSGSAAATRSAEAQNDSRIIEGEAREVASEAATLRQPVAAAGDRNAGQFIAGDRKSVV